MRRLTVTQMDMHSRVAAWRDMSAPRRQRSGQLRREGRGWLVTLGDHRAYVRDLVGMTHLARLLSHPGQAISALQLAGAGVVTIEGHYQRLLDEPARAAYATRARELAEDLSEAQDQADLGRAEMLKVELDMIIEQLEAATGLHAPRHFANSAERARTAVRKALKRAIDEIATTNNTIGRALHSTITTGSQCSYMPDPTDPIAWTTDSRPTPRT
jgi:hypothetical protein